MQPLRGHSDLARWNQPVQWGLGSHAVELVNTPLPIGSESRSIDTSVEFGRF